MPQIEIKVRGQIDEKWSGWLDDLTITHTEQNDTVLAGYVADQSALYGLLTKLRDLGLSLLSVNLLEAADQEDGTRARLGIYGKSRENPLGLPGG